MMVDITQNKNDLQLTLHNIYLQFGGVVALNGVNISTKRRELLAIIGPNGAGKTSLLNCINGFYKPQQGRVFFEKEDITNIPSYQRAKLGLGRTFQTPQLYHGLTVLENILAGRDPYFKSGMLASALYLGKARSEEVNHRRVAEDIIDFLELEPNRKMMVASLSYGLRKRVDLGRALALEPKLLLLDEPFSGMNREEKEDMARFVLDIQEEKGTTIVFIEHDMGLVMDIADRVIVLDFGNMIADGPPDEIKSNERVIQAYLGKERLA